MMAQKHKEVCIENLRLHKIEARFYELMHPEIFNVFEQTRIKREVSKIRERFKEEMVPICLDIGSGTGNLVFHFKSQKFVVVACDLSKEMLRLNPAEHKIVCDACHLPLISRSSELIVGYSVLHHLPDIAKVAKEICRISSRHSILYFDHDPFYPYQKRHLNKGLLMLGQIIWLLSHPHFLKKSLEYFLSDNRRLYLSCIREVDWKLVERASVELDTFKEILEYNNFRVKVKKHSYGNQLIAYRS